MAHGGGKNCASLKGWNYFVHERERSRKNSSKNRLYVEERPKKAPYSTLLETVNGKAKRLSGIPADFCGMCAVNLSLSTGKI